MRTLRTAVAGIAVATILVGCHPERGGTIVLTNADVPDGVIFSVGLRVTDAKLTPYGIRMDVGLDLANIEFDVRTGHAEDAAKSKLSPTIRASRRPLSPRSV